ncbi:hypothetical protein [Pseudolysinimonas sp.]|uniref:hypothetical protein n=1 Tax=Pseudolysinimonas sp. TaxID=2680009 RepID=UPI003F80E26D
MNSLRSWRAGSILVLVGGILATAEWFSSGRLPTGFAAVGDLAVGLGFVLSGIGIRRRYPACWLLMVVGGSWMLEGVVLAVAGVVPLPRWLLTAVLTLVAVTTVAAAVGMIVRGRVGVVARWALVLPAIATTVILLAWVTGIAVPLAAFASAVLAGPAVAPIIVGIVWLTVRDEPRRAPEPAIAPSA